MRLTIFRKGLLLIAVPLLFQLLFVAVLVRSLANTAEVERLALHTKDVLVEAEAAFGSLVLMQAQSRGFVLTEAPALDADAREAAEAAARRLAALERMVGDNPNQLARVRHSRTAAAAVIDWQTEMGELVRTGRRAEAVARVRSLKGNEYLDAVRLSLNDFVAEASQTDSVRLAELRAARAAQQWVIGGGAVGATLVTCFVAWLFSQGIGRRLGVVTRNAERLSGGAPLADPLGGGDEIARLDEVLHGTRRRLTAAADTERADKQALEQQAAALSTANESLRQQTRENEMFVYSVSHDLRSPLVNLQGFSNELVHAGADLRRAVNDERVPLDVRQRVQQTLDLDVGDSIKFIQSAVTRSAAIIDALLRLSRAGRVEYRLQTVDVTGVVRRVLDAMNNTIAGKRAEMVVNPLAECWGDPTAVEQIFGNLIGNAVNYLDPNRPGRIEVGMTDDGRAAADGLRTYYVRDNGLGIPAAYLGKVFVAFQRLHGEVAKGEGIGLALVRRVVERHGGRIWVESIEGVGTTFYVALPAGDPAAEQPQQPAPEQPAATGAAEANASGGAAVASPKETAGV